MCCILFTNLFFRYQDIYERKRIGNLKQQEELINTKIKLESAMRLDSEASVRFKELKVADKYLEDIQKQIDKNNKQIDKNNKLLIQ